MDNKKRKWVIGLNVAALLLVFAGAGTLAFAMFIVANIIVLVNYRSERVQVVREKIEEPEVESWRTPEPVKVPEVPEERGMVDKVKSRVKSSVMDYQLNRLARGPIKTNVVPKLKGKLQYLELSEHVVEGDVKQTDIPNGFVVRGPKGNPILVDFTEEGKALKNGVEVNMTGWLEKLGKTLPSDIMVLAHSVKGEDGMLIKSLEVNRLLMDGKPTTVQNIAACKQLESVAEALYEKYMDKLRKAELKCPTV